MDMMTEQEFDALWHRAEAAPHAARLMEEYPAWRRNRRLALGGVASMAAVVAVALPLLTHPAPAATSDNYLVAYCNRSDMTSQYWVEMADALLMEVGEPKNGI